MQREERVLDIAVESILQRVVDIKNSLQQLVLKIEHQSEQADWTQYLDSYSVISAQIYTLLKVLKNEKTPILRNYLTLPLQLNAEQDDQLLRATEQRVPAFSHDFAPNMLRTKPEPEVEAKLHAMETKMAQVNTEIATKQITVHNKVVKHILDIVNSAREDWESDSASRTSQPQTSSQNETLILVAALGTGKGIKMVPGKTAPPGPSPTLAQATPQPMTNKAPSAIKTNIKAAAQLHPYHPYSR